MKLQINGQTHVIDDSINTMTPLLWVLRDHLDLTGTKYGCGIGQCGTCTVHLNGLPVRSCLLPLVAASGARITTIEGIASEDGSLHPLQTIWIEQDVPQCGFCQPGQIMSALGLLQSNPSPTDEDIDTAMHGNLCRCGTYPRIRKAIHTAADAMQKKGVTS